MTFPNANYDTVPLKISTADRVFTDTKDLDTSEMLEYLSKYNGRSTSSCPNVSEWLSAFGEAENVFCVTITSGLSGSYNSACAALQEYIEADPSRKGYVILLSQALNKEFCFDFSKEKDYRFEIEAHSLIDSTNI